MSDALVRLVVSESLELIDVTSADFSNQSAAVNHQIFSRCDDVRQLRRITVV